MTQLRQTQSHDVAVRYSRLGMLCRPRVCRDYHPDLSATAHRCNHDERLRKGRDDNLGRHAVDRASQGASIALQHHATAFVAVGSFATELVKVDAGTCPLRSESDRNIAVPRMNVIAKSGPTTPASGCISCRGYQRSEEHTS